MTRLTNGEHAALTVLMVVFVLWLLALPARADLAPSAEPTVIAAAGTPVPVTGTPPTSSTRSAPVTPVIGEPPSVPSPTPQGQGYEDDLSYLFFPVVVR